MSFLDLARRLRDSEANPSAPTGLDAAPVIEVRERIGAVLLRSAEYGDVGLALEATMLPELLAEESTSADRPVLLVEDLPRLRGMSQEMIRGVLGVLKTFTTARVVQ